ncbi:MAG: hypothetical protein U1C46_03890 [Bacteroidales bacterium]|nr:hypothetical protein [Bacteroidales bacterium]
MYLNSYEISFIFVLLCPELGISVILTPALAMKGCGRGIWGWGVISEAGASGD